MIHPLIPYPLPSATAYTLHTIINLCNEDRRYGILAGNTCNALKLIDLVLVILIWYERFVIFLYKKGRVLISVQSLRAITSQNEVPGSMCLLVCLLDGDRQWRSTNGWH